jgi:predicted extracellular nuclease
MECRGADTALEFTRQRDKIISALLAIDADVVGLIEIENNQYEAVADLVSGLNAVAGAGTYAYVDTGYIGGDAIKVAFIYKLAAVSLVGDYAVLDSSVDPRFIDTKNRPALAQTFMIILPAESSLRW